MSGSVHDKLNRVRKPRVHITYEVETEGAQEHVGAPDEVALVPTRLLALGLLEPPKP